MIRKQLSSVVLSIALLPACLSGQDAATDPSCTGGKCDGTGDDGDLDLASELPEHCSLDEIVRITRPVASDKLVDGSFSYGFRYKAPATPDAPVLVYLPGGPGSASTSRTPDFVPEGWGYLMTDPRGVGCNTLAELPEPDVSSAFFRTQEIARDVVAAIEDRQLTNYIVFGISYGTALGTTVAHELELTELPAPTAVVLEGVLGRAFGEDFVGAEYIRQWDRVRAALPADVRAELDTALAPFGFTAVEWSRVLMGLLPLGPLEVHGYLATLSSSVPEETRQEVLADLAARAAQRPFTGPGEVEMYRQVACRELMDTVPENDLDVVFEAGQLVRNASEEGTKCKGLTVTTPYDAATLQFTPKTYYFLGDSDVATPIWQGNYHFDNHLGSATKIVTQNGGHNPLEYNQIDCAPKLMASIAAGGADLETLLAECPMPATLETK
ncbi:MAG: alpha/beta hydrolase [Kofleriaceae bacterium]